MEQIGSLSSQSYAYITEISIVNASALTSPNLTSPNPEFELTKEEQRTVENVISTNTITDTITKKVDNPTITVSKEGETRIINVTVDTEYRKEYSLDYGKTWLEYEEPFEVSENIVIFTRVVDNENNILSSSTYTITSLEENTQEIVEKEKIEETTEKEEVKEEEVILPPDTTSEVVEENNKEEEKPIEGSDSNE